MAGRWEVAEDGYEEQIVIPNEKRELAASEGIRTENKDQVAVQIEKLQGVLGLPYLPVLNTGPFIEVGKKGFNILTRAFPQSLSRQKINIGLDPFDIKELTIRPHPVILHTGPKRIPEFLSRCVLLLTFFLHKSHPIQAVNLQLTAL